MSVQATKSGGFERINQLLIELYEQRVPREVRLSRFSDEEILDHISEVKLLDRIPEERLLDRLSKEKRVEDLSIDFLEQVIEQKRQQQG